MQQFGKGGENPDSLADDEAQLIKESVREAVSIVGGENLTPDNDKLDELCKKLVPIADDIADTLSMAQGLAAIGVIINVADVPIALGYAVIAVALLRLGIRQICRNRAA